MIYRRTNRNHLYYINERREIKEIDESVTNLCFNSTNDTVFFIKLEKGSGILYYSSEGGESQPVPDGDGVLALREWNKGIVYQKEVDGKNNTYYNTEGIDFKLIEDGVDVAQIWISGPSVRDFIY